MKILKTAVAAAALAAAFSAQAQWKPTKPINIIVPWAAGGATDQVTRVAAGELEEALGTEDRGRSTSPAAPARSAPRTR